MTPSGEGSARDRAARAIVPDVFREPPKLQRRIAMISRRAFLAVTAAGVAGASLDARRAAAQEPRRDGTLRILQIGPAIGFNPGLEGTNWPDC